MFDPDSLEKFIEKKRDRREDLFFFGIIAWALGLVLAICIGICVLAPDAEAFQGIGTGFYGDGKVIKEEPTRLFHHGLEDNESFSVTDDVVDSLGFHKRETTYFDCRQNLFGEKVCEERRGW